MAYQCPLCQQVLSLAGTRYSCANNHQFDMAKEGYVNLMPAHHKRSKDPGDNQEMMQARRQFLAADYYAPMRSAVSTMCQQSMENNEHTLLDIGCGEGYYTSFIADELRQKYDDASVFGLDISKVAIRYAAKRYPNCQFSVASSHRLPFADQSLGVVLRIYAPCKDEELQRCIRKDGTLVTVTPASRHLYQIREKIYQDVRLHETQPESIEGFTLEQEQRIHYPMMLKEGAALNLLQMTPFAWKANEQLREELANAELFECEADFMLRVYRKL